MHPTVPTVAVYRAGWPAPIILGATDEITAEPALAQFRCRVADIFE